MMFRCTLLIASSAFAISPAWAQQTQQPEPLTEGDHVHQEYPEGIIITAPFLRDLDLLAGTSVLTGTALVREMRPQIGDTLTRLPGVSATSFSPGASRPVLRGFQGERVRVLIDGLGSIDASSTSPDHAVTIDPLTTDRIEVLHGPAVLLFGSQAIGGAVNAFDRRIPRAVPDDHFHVDAIGTLGSAARERSIGSSANVSLGGGAVANVFGTYRRTGDLRTGGFILSERLREEQLKIAEHEAEEGHLEEAAEALELAGLRGRIPNTDTETHTFGGGLALIRDRFNFGASVSWYDSDYGVSNRPAGENDDHDEDHDEEDHGHVHDHDHDHHNVRIGLKQIRIDLRGEAELGNGFFDRIRTRWAAADYEHTEFEDGEVGTVFASKGVEGRVELAQRDTGYWRGVTGAQYFRRSLAAVGAEAFLPSNVTSQLGLFSLQEVDLGRVGIEGAARYEHGRVSAEEIDIARNFNSFSAAVGASYALSGATKIGVNVSRAERAPAAEELFSEGPHAATQAYELGDPTLRKESSWGGEMYARLTRPGYRLNATAYFNRFNNFIYQAATGEEEDGLPVFQYLQQRANHWGFEVSGLARLFEAGGFRFVADGVADYVRATIRDSLGPVPRIPPLRLLGAIEAQSPGMDVRAEVERVFAQDRVAEYENPTEGFTFVNASVAWRPWGRNNPTSLILSANNIFDVEARRHASFTNEFAPLPGRDIRLSARVSF
jgi:iron complex outermembrane recepter protein